MFCERKQSGLIILAPSGTGKTHAALTQPAAGPAMHGAVNAFGNVNRVLIDGDAVIDAELGWPKGRWWDDAAFKMSVYAANWDAITGHAASMGPDFAVLFNGRPTPRGAFADRAEVRVVIPDLGDHLRHLASRVRHFENSRDKRARSQPTTQSEIEYNRKWLRELAQQEGYRLFSSIYLAAVTP